MAQKYYRMNIAKLDRDLPLCPISDSLMIGAFVIFGDPELTTACAEELLKKVNVDGGLIGVASLKTDKFTAIVKAAN